MRGRRTPGLEGSRLPGLGGRQEGEVFLFLGEGKGLFSEAGEEGREAQAKWTLKHGAGEKGGPGWSLGGKGKDSPLAGGRGEGRMRFMARRRRHGQRAGRVGP